MSQEKEPTLPKNIPAKYKWAAAESCQQQSEVIKDQGYPNKQNFH